MSRLDSPALERAQVFVLEDDRGFRDILLEFLAGEGLGVSTCDSYASLLEALQTSLEAIVVGEIWGESHRGLSAAERAEIRNLGSRAPTILLSGRAWAGSAVAGDLNLVCVLQKPPTLEDVLEQVRRSLAQVSRGD